MNIWTALNQVTNMTPAQLGPLIKLSSDAKGNVTILEWNVPNVTQPTPEQLTALVAAPDPGPMAYSLINYATMIRDQKIAAGIVVNTAPAGSAANNFLVDTTDGGRTNILGLESMMTKGQTCIWIQSTGAVALTAGELNAIALSAGLYVQECYQAWGTILEEIAATPATVKTNADIDAAAWPSANVSYPVAAGQ